MVRMRFACLVGALCALQAGCPSVAPAPNNNLNGNFNNNTNGNANNNANDNAGDNDNNNDNDGGPIVGVETGAFVEAFAGADTVLMDIYEVVNDTLLSRAQSVNELLDLPPGLYRLTEYFNEDFVVADSVPVTLGVVTHIVLGAVTVRTVPDSPGIIYDIYDVTGQYLLDRVNDSDEIRALPQGTYVFKEYFNDVFVFARDVIVTGRELTTIQLGAVNVKTVPGADPVIYEIHAADGDTLLDRVNDADVIRNVPSGTYVLTEYFNAALVFAADVVVEPGETTEVTLGAVHFVGGEDIYDIYAADGETLLARPNSRNVIRSLPAGTYVLKPYFEEENIIAAGVTVIPNEITVVP